MMSIILVRFTYSVTIVLLYGLVASLFFDLVFTKNIFMTVLMLLAFSILSAAWGLFLTTLTLKYKESAVRLGMLFQFFVLIFSGIFSSLEALPTNMQWISKLLPFTYPVHILTQAIGTSDLNSFTGLYFAFWVELSLSLILPVVLFILTSRFFNAQEEIIRKAGTLSEY